MMKASAAKLAKISMKSAENWHHQYQPSIVGVKEWRSRINVRKSKVAKAAAAWHALSVA
jgi:hypothetical protein